jgi:hypothetical protein
MWRNNGGPAAHDLDARDLQHALVDAVQARDLAVLVGKQRRPIEAGFCLICPEGPAIGLGDLEVLAEMRRVGEELLRDAADVDAGAAEAVGFGDRDLGAVGGADTACPDAARAAADGEKIVVESQTKRLGGRRYVGAVM